jgi:branched-chain amino acid transport system ATP-binding protein
MRLLGHSHRAAPGLRARGGRAAYSEAEELSAEGLSVAFDGVVALADVDLVLRRNEILGLIGPNGAGKTTLVNVLSGFQPPRAGRLLLGGQPVTGRAPYHLARAGVSRSFQGVRLCERMTVLQNVEVGAVGVGMSRRNARKVALAELERVGLESIASADATAIAFGSERLVSVARALASEPRFLLLDEPAAGLNEEETDHLVEIIAGIRDDLHCGVLVIEHDMRLIMRVCDRVHVLDSGRTLANGTVDEVRSDEAVIEAYLGQAGRAGSDAA